MLAGRASRGPRRLTAAAALLLACLAAGAAWAEQAEEADDGARAAALQALGRGDELREAGRCGEAIAAWRQGLRQTGHWVFFARIGDCYRREGRHERAIAYLQMALEQGVAAGLPEPMQTELETAAEQCRAALPARLQVAATAGEARVVVDGEHRGEAPMSAEIAPGEHRVTALREGSAAPTLEVRGRPGHVTSVVVPLEPTSTDEPLPSDEDEGSSSLAPVEASSSSRGLLGGLLLAAGALLAGGGAWLATWDGAPLEERDAAGYDTFAPGVGLGALGVGLIIGSIVLLALPPAGGGATGD